jgi:hypothetical protein
MLLDERSAIRACQHDQQQLFQLVLQSLIRKGKDIKLSILQHILRFDVCHLIIREHK